MKPIVITSQSTIERLSHKKKSRAFLSGIETLIHNEGKELEAEIVSILDAWESLRYREGQATRFNNPYGFGRRLLLTDNNDEHDCALILVDGQNVCAALHARIKRSRIKHQFGPISISTLKSTTMIVEYSGFVHDARPETLQAMQQLLLNFANMGVVDNIQLMHINVNSDWYHILKGENGKNAHYIEVPTVRWQTQLLDPETGNRIQHHSSKTRSTHRRKDRLLVEQFDGDVEMKVVTKSADVDDFIRAASSIVEQTYQAALGIGIREGDERLRAFLHELADEGFLRGYLLIAKGRAISYVMGDLYSKTYSLWATSYLPEFYKLSAGTVLLRRAMEDLQEVGALVFDFGRGDSDYKKVFGSRRIDENDVHIYAARLLPSITYIIDSLLHKSEKLARDLLNSKGLVDAIRRFWRRRAIKNK